MMILLLARCVLVRGGFLYDYCNAIYRVYAEEEGGQGRGEGRLRSSAEQFEPRSGS